MKQNLKLLLVDTLWGTNPFGLDWSDMFGLSQQGLDRLTFSDAENTHVIKSNLQDQRNDRILSFFGHVYWCTKMKIPIYLKPNGKSSFFELRVVPFARCQAVKEELKRWVKSDLPEHVDYSDYAALIAAVSKADGTYGYVEIW